MSTLAEFEEKFGHDAQLASELVLAAYQGASVVHAIVGALKETYGPEAPNSAEYGRRLREAVRVLKALEAHGYVDLPQGMFV